MSKKSPTLDVPTFLKAPEAPVEKQKPGPKPGVLKVTSPCPYCGEPAHRKAVQNVKGFGPLRRMYCANGCGHYHYRDVQTNAVVEGAGKGPRVAPFHSDAEAEMVKLRDELKTTKQALKRAESQVKQVQAEKGDLSHQLANAEGLNRRNAEAKGDWLFDLADALGIDPGKLNFTSMPEGKPRVIAYCFSEAEKALLTRDDAETIEKLHLTLLTVQECIRGYKTRLPKGKK